MAQRRKTNDADNNRESIAMVEPDTVIVHRRATAIPDPFIPKLAVKPGISVLDLLRSDDVVSERGDGE